MERYSRDTEEEFLRNISASGSTEMIADGLARGLVPDALTRVWCLYEVHVSLSLPFTAFSLVQRDDDFSAAALNVHVDMERASATVEADKDLIFNKVRAMRGGFQALNTLVSAKVRSGQEAILRDTLARNDVEVAEALSGRGLSWLLVLPTVAIAGYAGAAFRASDSVGLALNGLPIIIAVLLHYAWASHSKKLHIDAVERRKRTEEGLARVTGAPQQGAAFVPATIAVSERTPLLLSDDSQGWSLAPASGGRASAEPFPRGQAIQICPLPSSAAAAPVQQFPGLVSSGSKCLPYLLYSHTSLTPPRPYAPSVYLEVINTVTVLSAFFRPLVDSPHVDALQTAASFFPS